MGKEEGLYSVTKSSIGEVVGMAESFVQAYGITSDIEVSMVVKHISLDGRGIPFTKWLNSRNYNQTKSMKALKELGFLDNKNIVTSKCVKELDGGRTDLKSYGDLTLYNMPDGTVVLNTLSNRIQRLTGELVGFEEGYREDFRTAVQVKNKNILAYMDDILDLFPDMKPEYRGIDMEENKK